MNQSQVNDFLLCLSKIDDSSYSGLHNGLLIGPLNSKHDDDDHHHSLQQQQQHHHHHHHSSHDDVDRDVSGSSSTSMSHDLLIAKATAMIVLFCATTVCGMIPFLLNRYFKWTENSSSSSNNNNNGNDNARSATTVKCLLYFGGGVLLCTTFMHLLPEVEESVERLIECGTIPHFGFPLAQLLTCLGFFAMFLIEELIHAYIHRRSGADDGGDVDDGADGVAAFERGHSVRNSYVMKANGNQNGAKSSGGGGVGKGEIGNGSMAMTPAIIAVNGGLSVQDLLSNDIENEKYLARKTSSSLAIGGGGSSGDVGGGHHDDLEQECTDHHHNHVNQQHKLHHNHHNGHGHHHHHHSHHHQHHHHHHSHQHETAGDITSSLRGLLIVLALSLHELFEGMAIGLETTSAKNVWFMFGAVAAHKLVLAFCVGVELIVARTRFCLSTVYVLTFGIVSPIGIGVGILISHRPDDDGAMAAAGLPAAILQGMATGTLLYVVFFEILSKDRSGLLAYLAFFMGFAIMFALQQMGGHEHNHSHGGCGESGEHSEHADHSHLHHDHNVHEDNAQIRTFEQQLQILREASKGISEMLVKQQKGNTSMER